MRKSTQELKAWINEWLDWQSQPGRMFWKKAGPGVTVGAEAGYDNYHWGYWMIGIDYKLYKRSRLVFLMFNGSLPKYIDHRDGDAGNDDPSNLRVATSSQNSFNRKRMTNNTSGIPGIEWRPKRQKWQVRAQVNGKRLFIGHFDSKEEAIAARNSVEKSLHGEFRRDAK
jgi:hypothetical protein